LIIKKRSDDFEQKISQLRDAMNNEVFISDLKDISEDFKEADLAGWDTDNGV